MGLDMFMRIGLDQSAFTFEMIEKLTVALTAVHVAPGMILRAALAYPATRETQRVVWNAYIVAFP